MSSLLVQCIWCKRPKSNPYAERGLDQFALLSAELQAERERLVAQLGNPLSLVRFTISSDQGKWIPIIIAPTSSKAEMRALRRAASELITRPKRAFDAGISRHNTRIGDDNTAHGGSDCAINDIGIDLSSDVGANPISKHGNQTQIFSSLMTAIQGFLWMVNITAFAFRIMVDIVWSGHHIDSVSMSTTMLHPSRPKREDVIMDHHPSSSSHAPPPLSIAQKDIKRALPQLPPHVNAPQTHTHSKDSEFLSVPCSPGGFGQLIKPFSASISLPRDAVYPHGHHGESHQTQKTIPNKVLKIPTSLVDMTASHPQKLGQALSAGGVVVVLGGLVMGYIPALVSVVCWWYLLPRLRKAIGDKPFVRSHHLHHSSHHEDKGNVSLNNKARGTSVVSGAKDDLPYHEKKKKVITDGVPERRRRHSVV